MTLSKAEPQNFDARSEIKQATGSDAAAASGRGPEAGLLAREAAAAVDTTFTGSTNYEEARADAKDLVREACAKATSAASPLAWSRHLTHGQTDRELTHAPASTEPDCCHRSKAWPKPIAGLPACKAKLLAVDDVVTDTNFGSVLLRL